MSTSALSWFKSSFSGSQGDNCVEVAVAWRKSTFSGSAGDNCVEVATCPGTVHVRDSKDKEGPQLAFSPAEWAHFVAFAQASALG